MKVEFLNPGVTPGGCLPSADLQLQDPKPQVCCGSGLCGRPSGKPKEEEDRHPADDPQCPEPVCSPCNDKLTRVEVDKVRLCRTKRMVRVWWKVFLFAVVVFALYWKISCFGPICDDIISPTTRSDCNENHFDVTTCRNCKEKPKINMGDDGPFSFANYDVTNESQDNADDLPFFIPFLNN